MSDLIFTSVPKSDEYPLELIFGEGASGSPLDCLQVNLSSSVQISIVQTLESENCSQNSACDTGEIIQGPTLVIANCNQVNSSSLIAIVQEINLVVPNNSQINNSTAIIVDVEHNLQSLNCEEVNISASVAVVVVEYVEADNCTQINSSTTNAIGQGPTLSIANCNQINSSTSVNITQYINLIVPSSNQINSSDSVVVLTENDPVIAGTLQENYSSSVDIIQNVPTPGPILHDREVALMATNPRIIATSTIIESVDGAIFVTNSAGVLSPTGITLNAVSTVFTTPIYQWQYSSNADHVWHDLGTGESKEITSALFLTHKALGTKVTYRVTGSQFKYWDSVGEFIVSYDDSLSVLKETFKLEMLPIDIGVEPASTNLPILDQSLDSLLWFKTMYEGTEIMIPYLEENI